LVAGGCPLDYPEALPYRFGPERKPFRVIQLAGNTQSRVYMFGEVQIGYSIAVRLETDRPSGTIITDWSVEPPWSTVAIGWEYEPRDFVQKRDRGEYGDLLDTPLLGVLNGRRRLHRDHPVEGLLCGYSYQAVPEFNDREVSAKLMLADDMGSVVTTRIKLVVWRPQPASQERLKLVSRLRMALAGVA
jgi:hypothetical protein